MNFWKRIFGKETKNAPVRRVRSFAGARNTRFTTWINSSFERVNCDINERSYHSYVKDSRTREE